MKSVFSILLSVIVFSLFSQTALANRGWEVPNYTLVNCGILDSSRDQVEFVFPNTNALFNSKQGRPDLVKEIVFVDRSTGYKRYPYKVIQYSEYISRGEKAFAFFLPGGWLTVKFVRHGFEDVVSVGFKNPKSPHQIKNYTNCVHMIPEAGVTAHN